MKNVINATTTIKTFHLRELQFTIRVSSSMKSFFTEGGVNFFVNAPQMKPVTKMIDNTNRLFQTNE